jgi:hypothetical protein
MAMILKSAQRTAMRPAARSARRTAVVVRAAAERPVWYPGNPPPAHLDGT